MFEIYKDKAYHYILPSEDGYPEILKMRMGSDAPKLWYAGNVELLSTLDTAVSITGSRASTGYGEHVAMDFAAGLVSRERTVVSGSGYGIEGMAVRATLACGGRVVVVNPSGLDSRYPTGHYELLRRVEMSGLVVSLFEPGVAPTKERIQNSGNLIANLSSHLVVIESGFNGRAFGTGQYALENGLDVSAVPGPITSGQSSGSHRLLQVGARLVTSVAEVLEGSVKEVVNA